MALNARLMGRILSVQKILVGGIEKTPEGAVTDGKVTQYMLIRGSTGNDAIVDANGNLVCMLKGSENLPIAQDASGNMVAVVKGSENIPIAQDSSGNMIAAMKGLEGANVRDIAVDVNGNMVTLMKGDDGVNLQTIKVDATGQMYVAMTGQSLSVDNHPSDYFKAGESVGVNNHPSDYFKADESAVVKGDDGGTKRLIAVDTSGIMLSRMKGAYGGVLKDILLDDTGIMLSRMKGSFGGALKDIGVDTNGNMISIMKGAAGNNVAVDANGYLAASMKGLEGVNVRDIAVDVNGNMISVMKGNFAGALKTWKVDNEGRGEMFINDPTDVWGNVVSIGLSEHSLLVRAPPRSFDRRGNVIRWVDFESPSPNYEISKTANTTFSRSNDVVNHGSFSGKIVLPANANDYCRILQYTNDFHIGNMGYMAMFSSADTFFDLYIKLRYYDGTTVYDAELQYLHSTGALYVNTPGGVVLIEAIDRYKSIYNFSTIKLVADFSSGKYIRALMFGSEYDLSAYTIRTALSGSVKRIESMFEVKGSATAISTVYVDDMVITENEPEN